MILLCISTCSNTPFGSNVATSALGLFLYSTIAGRASLRGKRPGRTSWTCRGWSTVGYLYNQNNGGHMEGGHAFWWFKVMCLIVWLPDGTVLLIHARAYTSNTWGIIANRWPIPIECCVLLGNVCHQAQVLEFIGCEDGGELSETEDSHSIGVRFRNT
jgi:hypothetical protein